MIIYTVNQETVEETDMTKNEIQVVVEYIGENNVRVEMPEGKSWGDVTEHWIKWDILHVEFEDGTKIRQELDTDVDCTDWKRPNRVHIYECNDLLDSY